mmetsp:Transcript_14810/g.28523  ORF Transcript_14810/g.28523 Transcript_14810/m.28523 type:complete len:269 (-) Transcript_14810:398-1204(-)
MDPFNTFGEEPEEDPFNPHMQGATEDLGGDDAGFPTGGQGDLDIDFGAMSAEVPADNNSVGSAGAQPAGMDSLDMGDEFNAAPGMPAQEMDDDLFRSAAPSQAPELGMESSFGNENLVGSEGQQEEDHLGMMQGGDGAYNENGAFDNGSDAGVYTFSEPTSAVEKWRKEQYELLEQKQVEEEQMKRQLKEKAAEEKEHLYAQRAKEMEAKRKTNRDNQELSKYTPTSGLLWESVYELVDMTSKVAEGRTDLTRMRQLFVKLKHSPVTV